jgi:hypothetical protein
MEYLRQYSLVPLESLGLIASWCNQAIAQVCAACSLSKPLRYPSSIPGSATLDRWRCRRVQFVDSRTDCERALSSLGGMVVRFDNHFLAKGPAVVKMRADSSRLTLLKNLREINAQPARHASGTVHLPFLPALPSRLRLRPFSSKGYLQKFCH